MAKWFEKATNDIINRLNEIKDEIESLKDEAEDKYENYPENLKESETGYRMEERCNAFEEIEYKINELIEELETVE